MKKTHKPFLFYILFIFCFCFFFFGRGEGGGVGGNYKILRPVDVRRKEICSETRGQMDRDLLVTGSSCNAHELRRIYTSQGRS